jgi:hypothetical protein
MFNKDLDRLFQEKFKDFEEMPDNKVWKKIDKQINTKSRFNLLKIRLAGFVAVLLLFSLWFFNTDFSKKSDIKNNNSLVKRDSNNSKIERIDNGKQYENKIKTKNIEVKRSKKENNFNLISIASKTNSNDIVIKDILPKKHKSSTLNKNNSNNNLYKAVVSNLDKSQSLNNLEDKTLSASSKLKGFSLKMKSVKLKLIENKLLLTDLNSVKLDFSNVVKNNKVKEKIVRWEIGSVVAPIYYASLTKGSPIDYHISENEQISSNSFSYGVDVAYRLNKKWSIKSGIKKQNLSYTTKDVGLEFKPESLNTNFVAANVNSYREDFAFHSAKGENQNQNVTFIGDVKQELKYLELPIELKYNLLSNKIGIDLNGGFSALFLTNNEIIFKRAVSNFKLGEASNINKTDYTINLGFDTNINLSNSLKYSISPSFKYHLNTFSENDGGFKPYSIGINTGLYYKF